MNILKPVPYIAMALAGGLIALGTQRAINGTEVRYVEVEREATPVQFANLPLPGPLAAPSDFVTAAERSVNAVVHVTTVGMVQQRDPFRDFFWGYRMPNPQPQRGAGSGVIISDDGYIVTNNHVVENADRIQVHLNDNRSFDATVVGRDPSTDLALLKIEATRLPTLEYGDSDAVRVGEWVLAVGNPMNLTSTVTAGIVSAKARTLNLLQYDPSRDIIPVESFIQTDAAVNPGNSGGALVNTRGELVGINTAIQSSTGAFTGYSFAVPVNIVKKVTNDLLEYGTVQRAYIGVQIRNIDQELAAVLDLSPIRGVYVDGLVEDGAAREAGMAEGDVIVRVANVAVNTVPQLQEQVSRFRPGDRVNVTVLRDGRERTMNVVLKGRNGKTTLASGEANRVSNLLGAELVAASKDELKALDIEHGVKVRSLHAGKLRSSGVREGFIITRMDQEPVREPRDLDRLLAKKKGGVLIEGIYPNGTRAYYGMGL